MTDNDDMTRSMYLKAISQLEEVLLDPNTALPQKREALDAMHEVDRRFLARTTDNLQQRTEQMQQFIALLSELVSSLESQQQPMAVIDRLREIIDQSNAILRGNGSSHA